MARKKIAVVGIGKIAVDEHLRVIDKSEHFEVAATVSGRGVAHRDLPVFKTQSELFAAMPEVKIVANCTPPGARYGYVREAIDAGKDVLLEKPPTATMSEFEDLVARAEKKKVVLFQTWHSRFNVAVEATRLLLKDAGVAKAHINWRESVRKWHPDQEWIWEPGGFGVSDPGINALALFTEIMPFPVFVESAVLTYPSNRQTPVRVGATFRGGPNKIGMTAQFDWLADGDDWTIHVETRDGRNVDLEGHGVRLKVDGDVIIDEPREEYEKIYEHFAKLLKKRRSEVDGTPLQLTSDMFFVGRRETTDPFNW